MKRLMRGVVIAGAFAVFASVASAQVTIGPGDQTLTLGGGQQDFVFSATGVANTVSLFGFVIGYDPATAPYTPVAGSGGAVNCTLEIDSATFQQLVFFFPDQGAFRVSFGDGSFPIVAIPTDGVIARCPVTLKETATAGDSTLPCLTTGANAPSASDPDGNLVDVTCPDGTLHIEAAPVNTNTPTATNTPEVTATNTPIPPTATRTPKPGGGGGGGGDDDGCQVVASGSSSSAWLLLLAPAALLIARRRKAN